MFNPECMALTFNSTGFLFCPNISSLQTNSHSCQSQINNLPASFHSLEEQAHIKPLTNDLSSPKLLKDWTVNGQDDKANKILSELEC